MTDRFEKFSYYISEIAKLLHKIEATEMESLGLKGPYAIYLLAIARNESGISAARLSLECGRDKGDVSRAIKAMEEKGLVLRTLENARGYRAPITLTAEGKKAARRLGEKANAAVKAANTDVSEKDRRIFYDTLEAFYKSIRLMSESGVPETEPKAKL